MGFLDVEFQSSFQAEALTAGLALVLMLLHMFYHYSFLVKTFAASGAFQSKHRLLPLDSGQTVRMLSFLCIFFCASFLVIFLLRRIDYFSSFRDEMFVFS